MAAKTRPRGPEEHFALFRNENCAILSAHAFAARDRRTAKGAARTRFVESNDRQASAVAAASRHSLALVPAAPAAEPPEAPLRPPPPLCPGSRLDALMSRLAPFLFRLNLRLRLRPFAHQYDFGLAVYVPAVANFPRFDSIITACCRESQTLAAKVRDYVNSYSISWWLEKLRR